MRVLGWPAFRERDQDRFTNLLYEQMRGLGVAVEEFTAPRLARGGWDILHLHFPDVVWLHPRRSTARMKAWLLLRLLDVARLRGTRVVWTAHNLGSRDRLHPLEERRYWGALIARLSGVIHLSAVGRRMVEEELPSLRAVPAFTIPLSHSRAAYPLQVERGEARRRLGLAETAELVVFVGRIRRYKNLPHLIRTFRALERPHAGLLAAGLLQDPGLRGELEAAVGNDPRVTFREGRVPADQMPTLLGASDLVALPFTQILNSGSMLLALSFDRPVLVPAQGALPEVQAEIGADWIRTYDGELTSGVLDQAIEWALGTERAPRAPVGHHDPAAVALRTLEAYRAVLAAHR